MSHLIRRTRAVEPRQCLVAEDEGTPRVFVMLEGWACCSKLLTSGQRLITDLLLPGDISHWQANLLGYADHSLSTLTRSIVAEINPAEILEALERSPSLARALRWSLLQTDSILRQALINNGRRMAVLRIAHLICEVRARLQAVGDPVDGGFAWPLTQNDLADVTGMTNVHVSRSIVVLRSNGLILLERRRMFVPDPERLAALCEFRPDYLHLTRVPAEGASGLCRTSTSTLVPRESWSRTARPRWAEL
ncbi:Crp/Fnr family transcriptional regulator [Methylobacterium sp. P31]